MFLSATNGTVRPYNFSSSVSPFNADSDEDVCTFKKWAEQPNQPGFFRIFTIISVLTILVVLVVLGNALVIAAVCLRRRLRSPTGILIVSLAVADLLVGLVILPFSVANEVLQSYWIFGDLWCTTWLTMDIWMCTASIYNLVAISIDRYIAIIKPLNYPMLITKSRARLIVAIVWVGSFAICSPSILLASSNKQSGVGKESCRCTPANSGMAYIVFSASSSFYIPMIIVIFVYVRIYIAACAATKSVYSGMMQVTATANKNPKNLLMQNPSALSRAENAPILRVHRGSTVKNPNNCDPSRPKINPNVASSGTPSSVQGVFAHMNGSTTSLQYAKKHRRHSQEVRGRNGDVNLSESGYSTPTASGTAAKIRSRTHPKAPCVRRSFGDIKTAGEELKMVQLKRPSTLMSVPDPDHFHQIKQFSDESCIPLNGHNDFSHMDEGADLDDYVKDHERSDSPQPNEPLNPNSPSTNDALSPTNTLPLNEMKGPTINVGFLHPPTNQIEKRPSKKRNYGASVWNRIMRRAPRKKAGCAYEKRLSLEIKAAKTVAIVTGCFIFCWLGFSILYGFSIETNEVVWSVVFWLGYLNSALNPVIYTVFNREFRTCFKRLLTCNHMIFATRSTTQNMYNSYNSTLRPGKPHVVGYNSVVSGPGYVPPTRSSPPILN